MNKLSNFFNNLNNVQRYLVFAIIGVVIFTASTWASFSLFSNGSGSGSLKSSVPGVAEVVGEDPSLPRTEQCPLDGEMHTVPAREAWEKRRPLAVMIENHEESRPQSGLTSADVVYEAVAEGGITRFMAVYYCNFGDVQVGPVRSARTYFIDWLSEYDALYAHVGGANENGPADALQQIDDYNIKDLNQFSIGFPVFWRDYQRLGHAVATEHTMYSSTQKLWDIGAKRGWTATDSAGVKWNAKFVPWTFVDGTPGGNVNKIGVNFWESQGDYKVDWTYDASCNCYKRKNAGADHIDLNNKQQISPKNVVIQFMPESRANDGYPGNAHLLYGNKGQGKALIFQNGKVTEGQWVKANRLAREKFVDSTGKEIPFVKGQIWIETVPTGSNVTY